MSNPKGKIKKKKLKNKLVLNKGNKGNYKKKQIVVLEKDENDFLNHPAYEQFILPILSEATVSFIHRMFENRKFINDEKKKEAIQQFVKNAMQYQNRPYSPFNIRLNTDKSYLVSLNKKNTNLNLNNEYNYTPVKKNRVAANMALCKLYEDITKNDGKLTTVSVPINEERNHLMVIKEYYDQVLEPLIRPFQDTKNTLAEKGITPPKNNTDFESIISYMKEVCSLLQSRFSITYKVNYALQKACQNWIDNNQNVEKKKFQTFTGIMTIGQAEMARSDFLTRNDEDEYYNIEREKFSISEVEAQSLLLDDNTFIDGKEKNLKACRNKNCAALRLIYGFNTKTANIISKKSLLMPRQRRKLHLKDDVWIDSQMYQNCWICNFIDNWFDILIQLTNNTTGFITSSIMYVLAGTNEDYFPQDVCLSFDCNMLKDVKNFFGHVFDPKTPFHNFAIVQREDGRHYLKFFASLFQ